MVSVNTLLKDLIEIPSITGNESLASEYLKKFLTNSGFNTREQTVDKGRSNIIATLGNPKIYLSAHIDTVAPFIPYSESKSSIFGRGACDTKGCIAAMLAAAVQCKCADLSNFGLIFTVGEEDDFCGVRKVLESGLDIPFVVIGEPTSLDIVNGHYGMLVLMLRANGKAAHSSTPEKGINAIDILLEQLQGMKAIRLHPESLMSLVKVGGGIADNVIPDTAEATVSFRISPNDATDYFEQFHKVIGKKLSVEKGPSMAGVLSDIPHELEFITTRKTVTYCTELSFYKKGVVLGPGDIGYAHGDKEHISKEELNKAVETYSRIIRNFVAPL